jgi:hypothetical protein
MRKSERLRLLEMQLLRMEFEVELLNHMLASLMESNSLAKPELDAGKWYRKRLDNLE